MFRQMLENKRGVSNVVTTVLIILLALAAVAVLAAFILPTIRNTSTSAGQQTACFNVQVTPLDCSVADTNGDGTYDEALVKLRDDSGAVKQVKAVIANTNTGETATSNPQDISAYGTVSVPPISISGWGIGAPIVNTLQARAIAIVDDGQGGTAECPPSPTVITCHT
ncbi:hypothetical protein D6817_04080 [Candidatus Pacearchaeota archaeon]|nr:MAG: hypothetical protein D6817_04080 [Candidatus Pacearchaeota archaeon]